MDPYLCMQGNLVADPVQRQAGDSKVTRFRIAASGRRFDRQVNDWVDTSPVYMDVHCWRQLGDNVAASLHKGDTVLVYGRLCFREYESNGTKRQVYEIEATAVGPDLARYVTRQARPERTAPPLQAAAAEPAVDRSAAWGAPLVEPAA